MGRRGTGRVAGGLALVLVAAMGLGTGGPASGEPGDATGASHPATGATVALITGDQVTVEQLPDGRRAVSLDPAGRDGYRPSFETVEAGGQVYVIPSDAAPLVPDRLDRELFNVTRLAEYGYTAGIPVILTPERAGAGRLAGAPGLAATAPLPSIGATAATIEDGGRWWRAVRPATGEAGPLTGEAGPLAGIARVWLDRPVEVALDQSVPQIGAPAAWDAGFDGTGVTVAVLDTGVDTSHPDLAAAVVQERDFTGSGTGGDRFGHGTHVAGIVAGSGAASGGRYVGVAPGVELLNGKVLDDRGTGRQSWIIAGMEWAVAEGADVVNLSLGTRGSPSDGTDPLSQAVNQLTEAHGVLFVVAAGNDGPTESTVGSPGAADAALTVGSVDKQDQLAASSSRGPRLGDWAIKPDLTAPGVDIVAARAAGTDLGEPVDDDYTRLSGTSMATPHVAGAAAILLQATPELAPAGLKAALATTAIPHHDLDVYQQGGGRIDVPAALGAPLQATPAPLDLGYFPFPHDDAGPVAREISYLNRTDQAMTLELSLQVASREGGVPSDAMLSVAPATLAVAPGATATAAVTVDVAEGEFGRYGGYLVAATGGEVVTRTPVGFYKESERYTLTVEGIARDGRPAARNADFDVINVHDWRASLQWGVSLRDGPAAVTVPPGTYAVIGHIPTYDQANQFSQEQVLVSVPEVQVTGDTTVRLDARGANPITIDTPGHETEPVDWVTMSYRRADAQGGFFGRTFNIAPQPHFATESAPVSVGDFEFYSRWRLVSPEAGDSPFVYDLLLPHSGRIPADLHFTADPSQLARVDTRYHGAPDLALKELRHAYRPGPWYGASFAIAYDVAAGTQRDEYLVAGATEYQHSVRVATPASQLIGPLTSYPPGARPVRRWLAGPLHPGFFGGRTDQREATATFREQDELVVDIRDWVDGDGNAGAVEPATDTSAFRLYQDGELIAESARPQGTFPVSPEPASLRLELDVARDAPWWPTSTRTRTAWTVPSAGTTEAAELLPLPVVDYHADLDLTNTASRRFLPTIDLRVGYQPGADGARVHRARVWTSYDDGATWRRGVVIPRGGGRFTALLLPVFPPRDAEFVSLRVEVWDRDGNRIEQEITRAWQLPAR